MRGCSLNPGYARALCIPIYPFPLLVPACPLPHLLPPPLPPTPPSTCPAFGDVSSVPTARVWRGPGLGREMGSPTDPNTYLWGQHSAHMVRWLLSIPKPLRLTPQPISPVLMPLSTPSLSWEQPSPAQGVLLGVQRVGENMMKPRTSAPVSEGGPQDSAVVEVWKAFVAHSPASPWMGYDGQEWRDAPSGARRHVHLPRIHCVYDAG